MTAVVRRCERTPAFVVSDVPERATAWRIIRGAHLYVGRGGIFLLAVFVFGIGLF